MKNSFTINYKSLNQIINQDDIIEFRNKYPSDDKMYMSKKTLKTLLIIDLSVYGISLLFLFIRDINKFIFQDFILSVIPFSIVAIIFALGASGIYRNQVISWGKYIRLFLFAKDNNLQYIQKLDNPGYPGMIFNLGERRASIDLLKSTVQKPTFEISNYSYEIESRDSKGRRSSVTFSSGYIMIQLDRNLPHMVLDSVADNAKLFGKRRSDLQVSFEKDQKLSLEGDFDKYFTLYAPEEYKRDALYVFTPDLMALFIDESSPYDAEIIDNKLFIYSNYIFNIQDQATLDRLFKIIITVGSKTKSQTVHYSDERVGNRAANIVEESGRRLKRNKLPVIVIIFIFMIFLIPLFVLMTFFFTNFFE